MPMLPDGTMLPYGPEAGGGGFDGGGLAAMMGGLGGLGGLGAPGAAPFGPEQPEETDPAGDLGASELLQTILDLAERYRVQEQSQQNLLLVEKLRTLAQQILANEEKEADGLLQGKFSPGAVRRAAGG